jgi:hypothetical protein
LGVIILRDNTGVARTISKVVVRDGSNTARTLVQISIRDQFGTPHAVLSAMTAGVSAEYAYGTAYSTGGQRATTDPITAIPDGGVAPYTYAWTQTGGDAGWSALYPSNGSTSFRSPVLSSGATSGATFACSVTDSAGATATTSTVFVTGSNENPYL